MKAEELKLAALIKIAKEARISALRKKLDELLNDSTTAGEVTMRRRSDVPGKPVAKRLYTLKEAALSLGMSTKSVRNLVERGLLKPNRALRTILFPAAELGRFASETRQKKDRAATPTASHQSVKGERAILAGVGSLGFVGGGQYQTKAVSPESLLMRDVMGVRFDLTRLTNEL